MGAIGVCNVRDEKMYLQHRGSNSWYCRRVWMPFLVLRGFRLKIASTIEIFEDIWDVLAMK